MGINVIYVINDRFRVENDEEKTRKKKKQVDHGDNCLSSILSFIHFTNSFVHSFKNRRSSTIHRRKIEKEIEKKN